jgi:ATP-dependent DNA helicase 2 subunit 2
MGTCALALQDIARPDMRVVKPVLMGTVLRIGDVDARPEEAMEIMIKTSKCTALARPKGWKRFMKRETDEEIEKMEVDGTHSEQETTYVQLKMRTEYFLEKSEEDGNLEGGMSEESRQREMRKIEKEELIKGFKYGSTYVPCPDGQFERLKTRKGIDICGFFKKKNVRCNCLRRCFLPLKLLLSVSSRVNDGRSSVCLGGSRVA